MDYFTNAGLFELYGSTEAGWVTMLHPDEQFDKLGSVGRECVGSRPISFSIPDGNEVPDGEPASFTPCNPYTFDGYWKLPEKTRDAFRGDYCTVGDLARRDTDGFIFLVDRKSNMIISGGENVYPSDVEAVIGGHPVVHDVVVIGLPTINGANAFTPLLLLRAGAAPDEPSMQEWCKDTHGRLQASTLLLVHARRGHAADRDGEESASQAEGHDLRLKSPADRRVTLWESPRWHKRKDLNADDNPARPGSRGS